MITTQASPEEIKAWFAGRLPAEWTQQPASVVVDREEITVRVTLPAVELPADASEATSAEAAAGRMSGWREETRETRIAIAQEAESRFERKVSWGATIEDKSVIFTHLAMPVMTRLRQSQRQVLDTLVEAGVAKSRSDALKWCVKLVERHSDDWLNELRTAMENVRAVREQGPA